MSEPQIPKKKLRIVWYDGDEVVSEFETPPTSMREPSSQEFTSSQGEKMKLKKLEKKEIPPPISEISSQLTAIREAVKIKIGYGQKAGETDAKLVDDPRFKAAMLNLKTAPITCRYKGESTLTVIWDEKDGKMGYNDGKPFGTNSKGMNWWKCKLEDCWIKAGNITFNTNPVTSVRG